MKYVSNRVRSRDPLCGNNISISPAISVSFVIKTGTNLQNLGWAVEDCEMKDEILTNLEQAAYEVPHALTESYGYFSLRSK
jgi:hypothetical protein